MRLADRAYARAREAGADEGASARRAGRGDADSAGPVEPAGLAAVQATESGSRRSDAEPAVSESAAVSKPVSAVPQPTATAAAEKAEDDPQSPVAEPRQAENAAAPESVPAAESGDLCVQAGMFDNREAAAKAAEWIRTLGAESAEIRHRERRFVKHYRVFLPAFPSREAAVAKVRELRGRGIRDVAIMSKGARANEIALGLYKVEGNMRRRVAALKKLGYPAMSEPNMKTRSEYAVEARDGDALSALDRDFSSRFPGHPIRHVPCEDSG